ncbi:MAG: AgmX/PglI C-terminal domain-containing protein [Myxococcota bacterium]|jgi:hypothetical protein|nr:AgmX/PglI C-terminal domain-containing protein [Myxococcota bacterium]
MSQSKVFFFLLVASLVLPACAHFVSNSGVEAKTKRIAVRERSMQEPDPAKFLTPLPWPSARAVTALMEAHRASVASCVMQSDSEELPLFGHYSLRFVIGEDGVIRKVEVARSNLDDSLVRDCVLDVVRSVRFPSVPQRGGLDARHVFLSLPTRAYLKVKKAQSEKALALLAPLPE